MGPDLWELFEYGKEDDEVAAIIRLGHYSVLPKDVRVVSQFGEIVTVRLRRGNLLTVSGAPEVVSMAAGDTYHGPEVESEMAAELSSDTVLPTDERRAKDTGANGKGVVVGVVDWGFDFAHPDFRNEDGSSRIVALWDQRGGKRADSPKPFGYGIVHERAAINKALGEKDAYKALGYHPADADTGIGSHGTHVASIAAGTGGENRPGGIAHQADLVLVHNSPWDELESGKLGDSVTLLEAIDYISRTAGDRPWVINLSMGRHGEQHDGSTLIEQGLDAALRGSPGRAVCMSAGNYFNKRVHASGQLRPTQERTFVWEINEGHPSDYNQLEVWYSWQDNFECNVRSPDGSIAATVKVGERAKLKVGGKEVGNIYHRAQEPNNLDNHISIFLYKEAPSGEWEVTIVGSDVIDGRFHAWIEREVACPKCQSHFRTDDADPHTTTGTICNGRRTIAVGAYNAHDPETRIGPFSSVGPTRDGRLKPDLCAPGVSVLAARSAPREGPAGLLTRMSGTSMAAPHVTGTVALIFQAAPRRLRIEETHNLLLQNAKHVSIPEDIPDRIGIGFLDIDEAVEAASNVARGTPAFKEIVPTTGPTRAKAVAAGKESTPQEVAVEAESQEGFPAKDLIEAAVLQAASDMQSDAFESGTSAPRSGGGCGCGGAGRTPSAAAERAGLRSVESLRIPDERVRAGTGGMESESIGVAAESVRHPSAKSDTESAAEFEGVGIPAERAPRTSAGISEAEMEARTTEVVATMELESAEQESVKFVEVADQIVRQDSGRLAAEELLRAALENTACSAWMASGQRFPSAAEIFDAFAYWRSGGTREQLERCFEVVGCPASLLQKELRRSDVLVRRSDGDMGHISIIASPQLKSLEALLAEGLIPETFSAGLYAQVIETGTWPHELADKFARLITELDGRIPHWQLILRPKLSSPMQQRPQTMPTAGNGAGRTPEREQIIQAAVGMDAEGIRRLVDDLLLLQLATPRPTVVTVAPPAPTTTGPDRLQEDAIPNDTQPVATVVDPFPTPISVSFDTTNTVLSNCANTAAQDPTVADLCSGAADLTGNPASPPYAGHNDSDMVYVGSLAKIFSVYVAFELRKRLEMQAKSMIAAGLPTTTTRWEERVFSELKRVWKPKLDAAFPGLPSGFPKLADIFVVSNSGDVSFAEASPPVSDADLDTIGEFGNPRGKYRDWMRLMLRWSNNTSASKCILPLSYPYINGVLGSAGFFDKSTKAGLWLSGDYGGHDWQSGAGNPAGQALTARWARSQNRTKSNFTATALQLVRFMTALAQGKLVDATSSANMMSIANGAAGIGSYILGALATASPARSFSSVISKIGFGDDSFSHDCAIVTANSASGSTIRYTVAILGSPPSKGRTDLDQLEVAYHDCIVVRHP
jgi:subtilisin family serine protease